MVGEEDSRLAVGSGRTGPPPLRKTGMGGEWGAMGWDEPPGNPELEVQSPDSGLKPPGCKAEKLLNLSTGENKETTKSFL